MTGTRLLGNGYEPIVDDVGGKLVYSLPVDANGALTSQDFEITQADLAVLKADPYRYAILYRALDPLLQAAMRKDGRPFTQHDFRKLADAVLPAGDAQLKQFVAQYNQQHGATIDREADEFLKNRSDS